MTNPLDRIRSSSGIDPSTVSFVASAPPPVMRVGLDEVLDARHSAPTDVSGLRVPALVAGVLALLTTVLYRPIASWATHEANVDGFFIFDWIQGVVTVGRVNVWGPWVSGIALLALIAATIWTAGITEAETPAAALLLAAGVASVAVAAPLILAAAITVVAIAIYLALMVVIAAFMLAVVLTLLAGGN